MHPWQSLMPPEQRSYDRNPKSLAYVPQGEEGEYYYAGGFNGGKTDKFLEMAEIIADRVNKDLDNKVIAKWHDESHLNRYLIDNPATLTLSPNYCFDEQFLDKRVMLSEGVPYPFQEPKIIALKKDYEFLRS
jgi:histo-blood group ABO system transferase